jgi:threonine dehydrogenase-like Zn-dependent dehydrogenase
MGEFGRILPGFWTKGQSAHYPLPVILVGGAGGGHAGDTVVIFGAGGVGLNAVSGARIACVSRIIAIDI